MSSLLVISKDYWQTTQSVNTSQKFINVFVNKLNISNEAITQLIGPSVNVQNTKVTLYNYVKSKCAQSINGTKLHLYIYINGHGNQISDTNSEESDNKDEIYQLPDGYISDDEFTDIINQAVIDSKIVFNPFVLFISDHCSSGSMLDKTTSSKSKLQFDWITIGSCFDYEDSYTSGDGNVMTFNLLNIIEHLTDLQIKNIEAIDLFRMLDSEMKSSFIGELQNVTINFSDKRLINYKLLNY
jgi:hypothetical protein